MDTNASDKSEKQPVRVTILSQTFTLLVKGDPREVELLAQSVDELMSSIAAKAPNADTTRVAVLACLHLADRLHSLEQDLAALNSHALSRSPKPAVASRVEVLGGLDGRTPAER